VVTTIVVVMGVDMEDPDRSHKDFEDMRKTLFYFKMTDKAFNWLALTKKSRMKDIKDKAGDLQGFNHLLEAVYRQFPDNNSVVWKYERLLGVSPQQRAVVRQWLQEAILLRRQVFLGMDILREIDNTLAGSTFIAGHFMTLADPLLFLTLHPTMIKLSFAEKEAVPHLCRWFRFIQIEEELSKDLKEVIFSRNQLYTSSAH